MKSAMNTAAREFTAEDTELLNKERINRKMNLLNNQYNLKYLCKAKSPLCGPKVQTTRKHID